MAWQSQDLSALTTAPSATGNPAGFVWDNGNTRHILYRGSDDHIHEIWRGTGPWTHVDLTAAAGAPLADSDPAGYSAPDNTQHIVYRGKDNHIHQLWFDDSWHHHDLGGDAVSAPHGYAWAFDNTAHVVYQSADNHIHELWFGGTLWHDNDLTWMTGAPLSIGKPWGYTYDFDDTHTQHVVYRGADLHIHELWFRNGAWKHEDLTADTGAPLASSDPTGYSWDVDKTEHVIYTGLDNHIHELYYGSSWIHGDLSAVAGAPDAASAPAACTSACDATQRIAYRGTDNHIHELRFDSGWSHSDITAATNAPDAAGDPAAFAWDVDLSPNVIYRGTDNHIHALVFDWDSASPPQWFASGTDSQGQPARRVSAGNQVEYLIRGRATFDAISKALATATGPGHSIYILGWWLTDHFDIGSTGTMREILTAASNAGVQVRAMLWDQTIVAWQNTAEVNNINALAHGAAILDGRTLTAGSQHQKVIIVNGSQGLIAFCGGVDISFDRVGGYLPILPGYAHKGGLPMHDVHCQIRGPAVVDLLHMFRQRWNDHPDHVALDKAKGPLPVAPGQSSPPGGQQWVQIGRIYPNGNNHAGIDNSHSKTRGYTFLVERAGEQTAKQMILHAIDQARSFIYLEDQYLVSLEIRDALIAALPRLQHLTILIGDSSISDLPQIYYRRQQFIAPLRKAGGAKVRVFHPFPILDIFGYIHSKLWIFDDEYAIIGSANCNRRSYTCDSEVVAGIYDQGSATVLPFAQRLRMELWALQLNLPAATLKDGVASAALWPQQGRGGYVEVHDENADIEAVHPDATWDTVWDPDGS